MHDWFSESSGPNEDNTLLGAYADELEKFFVVVVQSAVLMKSELCEMTDPMKPSKVFGAVLSTTYGATLRRLHSVYCQMMAFNVFNNVQFT